MFCTRSKFESDGNQSYSNCTDNEYIIPHVKLVSVRYYLFDRIYNYSCFASSPSPTMTDREMVIATYAGIAVIITYTHSVSTFLQKRKIASQELPALSPHDRNLTTSLTGHVLNPQAQIPAPSSHTAIATALKSQIQREYKSRVGGCCRKSPCRPLTDKDPVLPRKESSCSLNSTIWVDRLEIASRISWA